MVATKCRNSIPLEEELAEVGDVPTKPLRFRPKKAVVSPYCGQNRLLQSQYTHKERKIMSEFPTHGQENDWAYLLLCVAAYIGVFIGLMFIVPQLSEFALWAVGAIV